MPRIVGLERFQETWQISQIRRCKKTNMTALIGKFSEENCPSWSPYCRSFARDSSPEDHPLQCAIKVLSLLPKLYRTSSKGMPFRVSASLVGSPARPGASHQCRRSVGMKAAVTQQQAASTEPERPKHTCYFLIPEL